MAHHELVGKHPPLLYPVPPLAEVAGDAELLEAPTEYEVLRAELSDTAATLYGQDLSAATAFRTAFAIVGEDVADAALRERLQIFYLGPIAELTPIPGRLNINNTTTRAFVPSPSREQGKLTAAYREPIATYLARQALLNPGLPLEDKLKPRAESNLGALFRALIGNRRLPFSLPEAELAVSALTPLVAADLQQTLRIGYEDYAKRARR